MTGIENLEGFQVVFAFPEIARAFEQWLEQNGWELFRMPAGDDELPTYAIRAKDMSRRTHRKDPDD